MAKRLKYQKTDEEVRILEQAIRHDEKPEVRQRATAICMLHLGNHTQLIIDWRPLEYLTLQETLPPPGVTAVTTTHLTPIAGGTRMTWAIERAKGPFIWRKASDIVFLLFVRRDKEKFFRDFAKVIETDIREGKIVVPDAAKVPAEAVTQAIGESLAT